MTPPECAKLPATPLRDLYVEMNNGRLALFRGPADEAYWTRVWRGLTDKELDRALRDTGSLGTLSSFLVKRLPRDGVVLEAGCGTGLWVQRLRHRGYDCIGVDYALPPLARTRAVRPSLPLAAADAFSLPFLDGSLAAYVSFGVAEHFLDGPQSLLVEAHRVLRPGGVILISVPYDNQLRRRVDYVAEHRAERLGLSFFQYYFSPEDMASELQGAGFAAPTMCRGYGVRRGLSTRFPRARRSLRAMGRFGMLLDLVPPLRACFSHMMMYAAVRPDH